MNWELLMGNIYHPQGVSSCVFISRTHFFSLYTLHTYSQTYLSTNVFPGTANKPLSFSKMFLGLLYHSMRFRTNGTTISCFAFPMRHSSSNCCTVVDSIKGSCSAKSFPMICHYSVALWTSWNSFGNMPKGSGVEVVFCLWKLLLTFKFWMDSNIKSAWEQVPTGEILCLVLKTMFSCTKYPTILDFNEEYLPFTGSDCWFMFS